MPLLTKREQSLVQLVAEGRTDRDISSDFRHEHTVRNYLFRIFNNSEHPIAWNSRFTH